ncbi:Predicted membrane protein [Aedoeadaptatus ivorii]|uniref:Predicted membrane protein n=1 Tax=Aedoeadaptatus ivorii TaxID=54006 RepID=A0A3S5F7Y3_9FIRM|nr:aromatic acid exporter family protein [Peptoniphilus ivorii]MDQ0508755.1 hypothetical protein [Peptoniphilus ivorii]VEJ36118.1 Predicted membrane protein [Peptoniphilus ivorii]
MRRIKSIIPFPHIGMRTFKTALSVVISLFLSNYLGLNTPLFVAIASMTTMQPSVHETHRAVRLRVFTCVMGVVLGYFLSLITRNIYIRPLIAGIGIIIIILILNRFQLNRFINLTNIIFVASFASRQSQLVYGINRLIGTLLGIFVSVAINYLIAKPTPKGNFESVLEKAYADIFRLSEEIILADETPILDELAKELDEAEASFQLIRKEVDEPFSGEMKIGGVEQLLGLYEDVFLLLQILVKLDVSAHKFTVDNKLRIQEIFHYTEMYEGRDEVVPDAVVNYHVKSILEKLVQIQELYDKGVTHV